MSAADGNVDLGGVTVLISVKGVEHQDKVDDGDGEYDKDGEHAEIPASGFYLNNQLIVTDKAGKSYYKSGDNYGETKGSDTGSTCGNGQKQGTCSFEVSMIKTGSDAAAIDANLLASLAGTYYVRITAGGQIKLSLSKTTSLGTSTAASVTAATSGALGAELENSVDVMKIVIAADGGVTYYLVNSAADDVVTWGSANSWLLATIQAGTKQETSAVFYGIQVADADLTTNTVTVSATSLLTPSLTSKNAAEAHTE